MEELLSLAEAAAELGLRPVSLRAAVARGTFRARKFGNTWVTTRDEVERYATQNLGQVGRPPIAKKVYIGGRAEDVDGTIISEPFRYDPIARGEVREPPEIENWRRRPIEKKSRPGPDVE